MKISIVHFTDLHITDASHLEEKFTSCLSVITNEIHGARGVYFVLSGDIAYEGTKADFDKATKYFNLLKQLLEKQYPSIKIKMVIVPGNHDCNFSLETQLRRNSITNVNYGTLGSDDSVIKICLGVQDDFWDFYSQYNPVPEDKLFYRVSDNIDGRTICFHCLNTSWMSQMHEKVGSIFFPVKNYDDYNFDECSINIGVFHHPYNWFTPNTAENNKKELERFTQRIASVHLLGHEHEKELYNLENVLTGDKIRLISGNVFNQDANPKVSGFGIINVDLDTNLGKLKIFEWNKTLYQNANELAIPFSKSVIKQFEIRQEVLQSMDEIKIPLTIADRKQVRLSEIFVFPDLEAINSDVRILDNYKDSIGLLSNKIGHSVICGEDQIGKTSLLNIIYLKKYNENVYPLIVDGKDIKELNLEKILKRAFKAQYTSDSDFDAYLQLNPEKKILLIDDCHEALASAAKFYQLVKEAKDKFGKVVLTITAEHSMMAVIQTEFKDIDFFKIKPLGFSKRNALIEQYHYLKNIAKGIVDDSVLDVREAFDKVTSVLGEKLIPSYPIYILSILQALDYSSLKQNETSFGYCYQTLIHLALHKAGVKNEDVDTYFNFLTELAYDFIKENKELISETELLNFVANYKKRFHSPAYDVMIRVIKNSKILHFKEDEVSFGYDYILYYLSAKKIADIIHTKEGKEITKALFDNFHLEKNGNILVFITHHSKDVEFIEESVLNSMIVLSNFSPITLAIDDPFYNHIKEVANEVSKDILEINKNPREERERQMKLLDEQSIDLGSATAREMVEVHEDDEIIQKAREVMLPFKQSFRAIEIVGQIVRNRKGSLEITKLKDMIKELYITGFRTISYTSELMIATKNQLILMINDDESFKKNKSEIEEAVNGFVLMSSYEACLGIFTKLSRSMGLRDLKALFNEVSDEINTPAAQLVSFHINSYYGSVTESELRKIATDLKGNPVALKILRSRVKAYVYGRNLDYKIKNKFASILGMQLGPQKPQVKSVGAG